MGNKIRRVGLRSGVAGAVTTGLTALANTGALVDTTMGGTLTKAITAGVQANPVNPFIAGGIAAAGAGLYAGIKNVQTMKNRNLNKKQFGSGDN